MHMVEPEPVSISPVGPLARPVMAQCWLNVVFLHWRVSPEAVAPHLPPGTRPDTIDGASYIGLVALAIRAAGVPGLPGIPYLGNFPEVNVRLYSVGADGRRGVVFLSLDAARLAPVLAARAGVALPYMWARMRTARAANVVSYHSRRRWPGPSGAGLTLRVRVGEHLTSPADVEHFVTARWGLHAAWHTGQTLYLPVHHHPWVLHRAEIVELAENLLPAAGLPTGLGEPVSVLYSPGVAARAGFPQRSRARRCGWPASSG